MPSVFGAIFEIGESSGGTANLNAWLLTRVGIDSSTKLLGMLPYDEVNQSYVVVLASSGMVSDAAAPIASNVISETFDVRNGVTDLTHWLTNSGMTILHHIVLVKHGEKRLVIATISTL